MRSPSNRSSRAWLLVPLFALGFLAWVTVARVQRVDAVSRTDSEGAVIDATSPTGYADGKRWLIVPEHANRSYQWVAETQQMLATGELRVRHVDYDNAPFGRAVHAASPYRWWLGFIAWCDHALSGRPLGLSAERAAVFAGPVLQLLLIVTATIFTARRFGHFPGALLAVGLATIYPFAGGFLPGVPDDRSLAWTFNLGGMLLLLAGTQSRAPRDFLAAAACSGLGLWISPVEQLPVLAGIFIGAGVTPLLLRRGESKGAPESSAPLPWRMWALGGATCCVAAYLFEYFPAHMDFQLRVVHPLYGLVWLAVGELLAQLESATTSGKSPRTTAAVVRLALASAVLAGCVVFLGGNGALTWLIGDPAATRLSYLPNGVVAQNSFAWVARDGATGAVVATWLSLLVLGAGIALVVQRKTDPSLRT
ncbi:MAG TPA: hypothetical protein VFJ90_07185, partial [Candidatus Didemnitutus sp.]|nr:hypothetical protein [Candidatus Didemnitutus sp.]